MKHDVWVTAKLVGWFVLSMIAGIAIIAYTGLETASPKVNLWVAVISIVVGLALGVVFWYFVMRYIKQQLLIPFSIGIGYVFAKTWEMVFPDTSKVLLLALMAVGVGAYIALVKVMRKSWEWTRALMPLSNLLIIGMTVWVGALLGSYTPPLAALFILLVFAIYDAVAVWKTKHMQEWAKEFLHQRIVPGIAVAKKQKEKFALLGGGDVFSIIFVAGSFWKTAPLLSIMSVAGMSFAVILLFFASRKGKFYPALPFILVGELGVLCASWVAFG